MTQEIDSLAGEGRVPNLRGCLRSQRLCQSSEQNTDHGNIDKRFRSFLQNLIIFTQAPTPVEPPKSTLNHPSLRQHLKALGGLRAQYDFENPTISVHHPAHKLLTAIATINPDTY